jgi:hypothetical protein
MREEAAELWVDHEVCYCDGVRKGLMEIRVEIERVRCEAMLGES